MDSSDYSVVDVQSPVKSYVEYVSKNLIKCAIYKI